MTDAGGCLVLLLGCLDWLAGSGSCACRHVLLLCRGAPAPSSPFLQASHLLPALLCAVLQGLKHKNQVHVEVY